MDIVLILAGGVGSRAGGSLPKQFQTLKGKRVLWWSVETFRNALPGCRIVLVVHQEYIENWELELGKEAKQLNLDVLKTAGGNSRLASVRNGLSFVKELDLLTLDSKVYIHDSARPLVSDKIIKEGGLKVRPGVGAVPVVPVADSLRRRSEAGSEPVAREEYMTVQTPQIFMFDDIFAAYSTIDENAAFTDDASVAEKSGIKIETFEGDPLNFKITRPIDFIVAEHCGH